MRGLLPHSQASAPIPFDVDEQQTESYDRRRWFSLCLASQLLFKEIDVCVLLFFCFTVQKERASICFFIIQRIEWKGTNMNLNLRLQFYFRKMASK